MKRLSSADCWQPELYENRHSFVWELASSVVDLLAPQKGERILDLGCGTGQLTAKIAESGADVTGLDSSRAMINEAKRRFPHLAFIQADIHSFDVDRPVDALFSNATLHWIHQPELVAANIANAVRPGGRVVVEFGGAGNVRVLANTIEEAFRITTNKRKPHPWYFPDIADFSTLLRNHGVHVTQAALIDRPTPLEDSDGLCNWVRMFGTHWLTELDTTQAKRFFSTLEDLARPNLWSDGRWHADYRRIRVVARKPESV